MDFGTSCILSISLCLFFLQCNFLKSPEPFGTVFYGCVGDKTETGQPNKVRLALCQPSSVCGEETTNCGARCQSCLTENRWPVAKLGEAAEPHHSQEVT